MLFLLAHNRLFHSRQQIEECLSKDITTAQCVYVERHAAGEIRQENGERVGGIFDRATQRGLVRVSRDRRVDLMERLRQGEDGEKTDLDEEHDQQVPIDRFQALAWLVADRRRTESVEQRRLQAFSQCSNVGHGHEAEDEHQ